MRILVVTAVPAERDAVLGGSADDAGGVDVVAAGVGPAAAAAGTAMALARTAYDLVLSAGIGGGFADVAPVGTLVVADRIVAADLGADSPAGFLSVDALGFGTSVVTPARPLSGELAKALGAVHGPVLTVSTVTGTAEGAAALTERHPGAAAEAMEGFGVARAASAHGVPVLEIRTISNTIGPRDRDAWRIPAALDALTGAFTGLARHLRNHGEHRDHRDHLREST
ncbi:MAG: futalosine hydrolase [Streptomycetaceae bacterium]|nr:futalosine hydrolase [Streptomycetaceae bacterium]